MLDMGLGCKVLVMKRITQRGRTRWCISIAYYIKLYQVKALNKLLFACPSSYLLEMVVHILVVDWTIRPILICHVYTAGHELCRSCSHSLVAALGQVLILYKLASHHTGGSLGLDKNNSTPRTESRLV